MTALFYGKKYNLGKKQATLQVVFAEYRVLFNKDSSILKIERSPKVIVFTYFNIL